MKKGNKYGTHRVIEPKGVLPQPANKIDNNMDEIYDNEILIDVQTLNVDSASFTDISNRANHDPEKIKERLSGSELNLLPADLKQYAHVIVNDNLNKTKETLNSIISRLEED